MGDNAEQSKAAVAFIDLVSFTALTDVHGDHVGADAAVAIEQSAVRRSGPRVRLVKATGDGVLLRATTPADGLRAAGEIVEDVHELGLDARAGVHYGPVVARNGDIYGSTVNLASRLASLAQPGTVMVTRPVALAVDEIPFAAVPQGPTQVKGLHDPVETFLVDPCNHEGKWVIDPVCGMRLDAATARPGPGPTADGYGFCSPACVALFADDPGRYPSVEATNRSD